MVVYTNLTSYVKRKIIVTTQTTNTKIKKWLSTKTGRKKENSSSILLKELSYEVVYFSQVESGVSFSQVESRVSSSQIAPGVSQEDLEILNEVIVDEEGQENKIG